MYDIVLCVYERFRVDGWKRYVNDDRLRVDGDKNLRLLASSCGRGLNLFDESLFTFKVSKQFKCIESNLFASMKKSVFTIQIQI